MVKIHVLFHVIASLKMTVYHYSYISLFSLFILIRQDVLVLRLFTIEAYGRLSLIE